jgi:phosphohistidine phosphatase
MLIHLLRHGDAVDLASDGPHTDEERPLTKDGTEKLRRAAKVYARIIGRVDRILSSPLRRAKESAEILAAALDFERKIEESDLLVPGAQPRAIIDALRGDVLEGLESVVLVGHEPHLGATLGLLLSGSERVEVPLRKGMLIGVDVETPRAMTGRLVFALSQKVARDL